MGAARAKGTNNRVSSPAATGQPPRLPETLVARERLYAVLDRTSTAPLTLLIAPAGTGKTVLLSAWADRRLSDGEEVVWIAAHDHHLLKSRLCEAVGKKSGPVLKVLEDASKAGVVPEIIVVDDAHLMEREQLLLLEEILSSVPDAVRLVLASRRDLALPVLELDLTGRSSTLRSRDLRFNDREATDLVLAHAELATTDDITTLRERTAGWAAALVLAARSLASTPGAGILNPALVTTDQPVLDLLLGEAFTTLSEPARQMLLSTFADPFTTAERASILSGNPDAGDLLTDLTSSGLLVTAYSSGDGIIYRYHPLLVELLRRRVVSQPADSGIVRLAHVRAAEHEESLGQYAAALASAIEAREAALITRLLIAYGPEILSVGEVAVVGVAFDALPAGHVAKFPHLLGVQGLHRRCARDVSGAVMICARAARALAELPTVSPTRDEDDALRADSLMLQLWQSRYGWSDPESTIADAHSALGCDHPRTGSPGHRAPLSLSPVRMSWLMVELAAAETWVGDLTSASVHLDEALVSARLAGLRNLVTAGLAHRAVIEYSRGDVQSAATTAQSALDHQDPDQANEDYSARAHVVLGLSAFNRLDLDAAQKWHDQVESSTVSSTDSVVSAMRMLLRACLLVEAGDLDVARRELSTDPAAAGPLPAFLSRDLCLLRYRCAALVADTEAAAQQVDAIRALGYSDEAQLLDTVGQIAGMDEVSAAQVLETTLEEVPTAHPILRAAVAGVRVALLLRAGQASTARRSLITLMNRVTPQQTLQALTPAATEPAFIELLADLAADADANPRSAAVLETLRSHPSVWQEISRPSPLGNSDVARSGDSDPGRTRRTFSRPAASIPAQPSRYAVLDGIPVKLTAREADVLGQLALGSSYTEIARDLFITENTVKTHLASLYRKLGVDKRSAALRVARDLGLLT